MIRLDVSFFILRPRASEGGISLAGSEPMCTTGVTVRSKLDECDLALACTIFSCIEPFAPLSLYTILAYFLLSWTIPAKIPLVVLSSFPTGKAVYYDLIRPSIRPSSSSSPFHVVSLSISFRSPRRLAFRGLRPPFHPWILPDDDDDPGPSSGKLIYQHLS